MLRAPIKGIRRSSPDQLEPSVGMVDLADRRKLLERRWTLPRAGFPVTAGRTETMSIEELSARQPTLIDGDVLLPALVIKRSALANNIAVMQAFTKQHGVLLAPHAKTTMAPQLLQQQLDAGAWGVTVANVFQANLARLAGARAILIANEVVGSPDIDWLIRMTRDDATTVMVQVDSPASAMILERRLRLATDGGLLKVLVELGPAGGRTGARDETAVTATARAIADADHLRLVGVTTYEGVVAHDREPDSLARIDGYLDRVKATTLRLAEGGFFDGSERLIVSAGGTRYVDRVIERLAPGAWGGHSVDLIVRAGCYITYGHGAGLNDTPFFDAGPFGQLTPLLELWAEVLSVPEPGLAIVGVGKRNVGERAGAIIPLWVLPRGQDPDPDRALVAAGDALTISGLDDQHAYLAHGPGEIGVGDRIGFGLQHPAALDRWRVVPIVDDAYRITDAVATFFA